MWYPDADADGFGDPARATPEGCLPPELPGIWLPRGGDCDDTRADVHPGAGGEAPHDGVDQDCDDETELDEDGDGIPDFRFACTSVTVEPETWPLGLQDVLDRLAQDPDGCAVIPLSTGDYGPIDVRSPVALVAVPGAEVRFASLAGGTAISATTNQPVEILLEKITFDGWDRTVDLGAGDLVASEIRVDGGEGVVVRALAGASRLTVYDAVFDAVDTVYDPLWTGTGTFGHVTFERVLVSGAVAPRSVLVGGTEGTRLQSVEIEHSAAIQTILRVPGDLLVRRPRSVVLDTVRVGDSLGRVLDLTAQDDDVVTIDGLELVGNITVDRQLLAVSTSGPRSPAQVLVTGLVALDNTMEPSGGSGIDLVSSAMFDFGGADLRMTGSTFVANDTESGWLVDGRGRIEATAFAGLGGGGGLRFAGVLAHTTLAGFGAGRNAVVVEASDPLVGLRLEDTLVADSAGRFGADVELAQVLVFGSAPSCDADPDCDLVPGDPGFLRAGSSVPPELVDLRVLPWSEAIDPGCSLGGCDVGAWTPTTAPADYASLDGDVLYDSWETTWLGTTTSGPGADPDADGLSNLDEFSAGTLPADADGDGDGTPDGLDPLPWDPSVP